jgi:hypothetical protein
MLVIIPEDFSPVQKVCCHYIEQIIKETSANWYGHPRIDEIELEMYVDLKKNKSRYFEDYIQENLRICSNEINGWIMWCDNHMNPAYFTHDKVIEKIDYLNSIKNIRT